MASIFGIDLGINAPSLAGGGFSWSILIWIIIIALVLIIGLVVIFIIQDRRN